MLFLYRGWNSGTNQAVLQAWCRGTPEVNISVHNVCPLQKSSMRDRLKILPYALKKGNVTGLWKGSGQFTETVKRSQWCMEQVFNRVHRIQQQEDFDFSFCIGSVIPVPNNTKPYFVYTDLAIRSNLYYPGGEEHVGLWRECLPYEEDTLRHAALVFTMSDHVSRSLVEHYGLSPSRILRVNGGCNVPNIESPDPRRYERQNVLFIGVDWDRKGGPELLQAFEKVRDRYPRATLTIVGCSPHVSAPGIEVVGKVPQDQIASFLARATLFCMPSKREPFGIAYLEAMRAGLPVIASDFGATPDFVHNGQNGYRVDPDDIDALARRIEEIIADPAKAQKMGQFGQELVLAQYTWQRTQQQMWHAIRQYFP
jgi:glycosyltransferase involved in cell wall biosynthesis